MLIPFVVVTVSTLSPEEERLWSIVRANSLEFNAWTALIEETERIAQVCVNITLIFSQPLVAFIFLYLLPSVVSGPFLL